MKISVLADSSGKILGALIPDINPTRPANSLHLEPTASQQVHVVDLPDSLLRHLGQKTLASELLKHRVTRVGKDMVLTVGP